MHTECRIDQTTSGGGLAHIEDGSQPGVDAKKKSAQCVERFT